MNEHAAGSSTNGLSWESAYQSVTNALERAVAGDELWVAEGTYYGPMETPAGVSLYGGFSGTETERTQRDWMRHRSVLSQVELDWFVYIGIPESVVTLGAGSRLDGFVIQNGYANYGSGVYVDGPGCVIANNTIFRNEVSGVLGGGGIFVDVPKRFPNLEAEEFFRFYANAFLRMQFPFGVTNIPVYPTNAYSPALHRLLQVAANLYDAKGTDPLPSVFRPRFAPDPNVPGGVIISGYYLDNDPATVNAWACGRYVFTSMIDARIFGKDTRLLFCFLG